MLMRSRNFRGKLKLVEKDHRELAHEPSRYDRFVSIGVHEHAGRDCNEAWIRSIAIGLAPRGHRPDIRDFQHQEAAYQLLHDQAHLPRRLHSQPCGNADPHGEIRPGREGGRESLVPLPPHRGPVAKELRDALGADSRARSRRFNEKFRRTWLFYLGGAAETFEAAREIINCYHITFVKGRCAHRG